MKRLLITVVSCLLAGSAYARGGGYVKTWDPNLFGGGWVCLQTQVAGCSKGYNASCNGIADDAAALTAFRTDAIAANPTVAKLYIPPGANCVFSTGGFNFDFGHGTPGIQNLIVWGYGAQVSAMNLGTWAFYPETQGTTSALIQQANIGDTSVTLSSGADASKFSVGDWIAVTAQAMMAPSAPPNWGNCEYKVITSIVGSVVSFGNGPLKNQYLTTWPDLGVDPTLLGGPARIFKMETAWNTNSQYYGFKINMVFPAGSNVSGRNIAIYDVDTGTGWGFSGNAYLFLNNVNVYGSEFDKDNSLIYGNRIYGRQILTFSGSDNTYIFENLTLTGSLNGTTKNETLRNAKVGSIVVGPTGFGVGNTLTLDGVTAGSVICSSVMIDSAALSFSAGTFSIANNSPSITNAWATFTPGHKYAFADSDGTRNDSGSPSTFTVTSVGTSGANVTIGTDLGGSLPASNCNTHVPCAKYVSWPIMTLKMTNSTAPGIAACVAP